MKPGSTYKDLEKELELLRVTDEALRKSELRLKEAQETGHVGHWELNLKNNDLYWSDEVYRIFDLKPQQFKATYEAFLENIHPNDRKRVAETYETSVKNKTDYDIVHRLKLSHGGIKYVRERCNTTYDENDNPIFSIGTVADVTELVKKEKKIKKQNKELNKLNATRNKLFSIIAHDLKSPFNVLLAFSQAITEDIQNKKYEDIEKYSSMIHETSTNTMRLLINLLEWTQTQKGNIELNPNSFNLTDLVEEVIEYNMIAAQQKNIKVSHTLQNNQELYANRNMILAVLRNLILNAIKYTHTDGRITISTETNKDETRVSVSDTGQGINAKDIKKLFHIKHNFSTPGTNKEKGTGLGLILCKELVQKHKGEIWVESKVGEGSVFTFTIPNHVIIK